MTDAATSQDDSPATESITEREARAAVTVLQEVASTYNGYITYADLQAQVTEVTRRPSRQPAHYWASRVLHRVIEIGEEDGHPQLTSLVVRGSDGMVGDGFNAVLLRTGRDRISDPYLLEQVAAEERLNCYRVYCPDLPEDARPTLTREYTELVERRNKPEPRERPVCASCGIQLPATGRCDDCD